LTGTLGVLLLAKVRGLVALLAPLLDELRGAGLYLDPALMDQVLALAEEST
jgi:predicted nucleic acid-binding protein